jgi:dihydropteroate synthase
MHLTQNTNNVWQAGRFNLSMKKPLVMGILNITPDSFSDGGTLSNTATALKHAEQLLNEGADLLDVGGESTRPGSVSVSAEQEWLRIGPVLTELIRWNVPVSVDSSKPEIMRWSVDLGVDILNDVNAFRALGAIDILASSAHLGAIVMHMQGEPCTMQQQAAYENVVAEVVGFLRYRLQQLDKSGVQMQRILVDPGIGFGKTLGHNLALLRATSVFSAMGAGVLIGVSRKSMIGELIHQADARLRVSGSVAAALFAASEGAGVLRVHDVKATVDALTVWCALNTNS